MPNHVQVSVEPDDRIIIVGDMHANFASLRNMFVGNVETGREPLGFPGDRVNNYRNIYLVNGDMVDRGGSGY